MKRIELAERQNSTATERAYYPASFALLDQMVRDGYEKYSTNNMPFITSQSAYTQGFLDGIRVNLNELAEAYQKDKQKKI